MQPPTAVFVAAEIFGPEQTLVRIKPRPTVTLLRFPTDVVEVTEFGSLQIQLAPQRRGKPKSFRLAYVVGIRPHAPVAIWPTYSRRGIPKPTLRPPAVVAPVLFFGPSAELAPSFRGVPKSLLEPPTVVTESDRFFGPAVQLARITPPKVVHFTITIAAEPFRPPHGDVCGFDIAGSFVCFLEVPGATVTGGDRSTNRVTGASQSDSKISGGDRGADAASGGDREAT